MSNLKPVTRLGLAITVTALAFIAVAVVSPTIAHKGATGVVKERMDDMKLLKEAMKQLKEIVEGKRGFDAGFVAGHARQIEALGARMPERFPKGTNAKPSEALDTIWQDWADFTTKVDAMRTAAAALGKVDAKGDFRAKFAAVGAACGACHKKYQRDE